MNIFYENFLGIPNSEFRFLGTEFKQQQQSMPLHTHNTHRTQQISLEVCVYIPLTLLNGIVTLGGHFLKIIFKHLVFLVVIN